ncbi:MAG: ATP-dependent sacrificial sulfur transferase LarE [Planctomycetaceae bacterium]
MSVPAPELTNLRDKLLAILAGYERVAVAYSGGVDSAVVAKAAHLACGNQALAVTAVSPSLAAGELEAAIALAEQIGIQHEIVRTEEFQNTEYLANPFNRCFFCKTELYSRLSELAPRWQIDVLANGANLDDQGDHRPGLQAAKNFQVRSPLVEAGLNKAAVRELAKLWELPVWDKPASPCLSSRIAYGIAVTPERVQTIDQAEAFLRSEFGLRELRVRLEANELARIEVAEAELERVLSSAAREAIRQRFHELGFRYVTIDLDGFRSGSLNAVVPLVALEVAISGSGQQE